MALSAGTPLKGLANATDTSTQSIIPAQGAGFKIVVSTIIIDNSSATATHVNIKDGTTNVLKIPAPAGSGAIVSLSGDPLVLSLNSALQFSSDVGVSTLTVSAVGHRE